MISKLQAVQKSSERFNFDIFGNIFKNKRQLEAMIKGVHQQLDYCQSSDLINFERHLQNEYNKVLAQEKMLRYQKSRENWIKFENKNTKFFHVQTVIRRRRNKVVGLNIDGIWCTNEDSLRREALSYFRSLFQEGGPTSPSSLHFSHFPHISIDLYNSLCLNPSLEEVKFSLFSMNSYKAPGQDGFQPIFFKTFWNIVSS